MVSRTRTIRIDDLDEAELPDGEGQTVTFSVGSSAYEIDLSDANLGKLHDALRPFTAKARRLPRAGGSGPAPGRADRRPAPIDRAQMGAMRRWALENGHQVSKRGRVSQEIQDAYHSAR